jgi:hypothetical protein
MQVWIGTCNTEWLGRTAAPLFLSAPRLRVRPFRGRALGRWALDSGGFTELRAHGRWTVGPARYAAEVRAWRDTVGRLAWAAAQDWNCEPASLARTRRPVAEHIRRTVENYLELRRLAPDVPWVPVVQGIRPDDYWRCLERYAAAGVRLAGLPLVGLGSVCRQQRTADVAAVVRGLAAAGLRLHVFGPPMKGLWAYDAGVISIDSQAWSHGARIQRVRLPGCGHATCRHCLAWALVWRQRQLLIAESPADRPALPPLYGPYRPPGQGRAHW